MQPQSFLLSVVTPEENVPTDQTAGLTSLRAGGMHTFFSTFTLVCTDVANIVDNL